MLLDEENYHLGYGTDRYIETNKSMQFTVKGRTEEISHFLQPPPHHILSLKPTEGV